jgi:hypothetical protein
VANRSFQPTPIQFAAFYRLAVFGIDLVNCDLVISLSVDRFLRDLPKFTPDALRGHELEKVLSDFFIIFRHQRSPNFIKLNQIFRFLFTGLRDSKFEKRDAVFQILGDLLRTNNSQITNYFMNQALKCNLIRFFQRTDLTSDVLRASGPIFEVFANAGFMDLNFFKVFWGRYSQIEDTSNIITSCLDAFPPQLVGAFLADVVNRNYTPKTQELLKQIATRLPTFAAPVLHLLFKRRIIKSKDTIIGLIAANDPRINAIILDLMKQCLSWPPVRHCVQKMISMRFPLAIVLLTRTGSFASDGSRMVPGFMSRWIHVSSPGIRS